MRQLEPGVRGEYSAADSSALTTILRADEIRDIMPSMSPAGHQYEGQRVPRRTIQYCKGSILNAIFTTALDDEVVTVHPSRGSRRRRSRRSPGESSPPAEFDLLTRLCPTLMLSCWSRPISKAGCAGAS